jgi:hypothetical protein
VPRVPPFDRSATDDDLVGLSHHLRGEIIDGELHADPRPAPRLASAVLAIGGWLPRGLGGASGPGSWQILPEPELHLRGSVLVPTLAGWKLSRLPELPAAGYFSVAPDWVCEILSAGAASLRGRKMAIYADEGVSHAWLIDPVARTLDVRRVEDGRWKVVATHVGSEMVRAEPFEALELRLGALWTHELPDRPTKRR